MEPTAVRAALEERRAELSEEIEALTARPLDPMPAVSFGKRVGDGTTEAVERLNTVGAAQGLAAMLADVERALVKLDEGTYGACDSCGEAIPAERLEARPWSVLCLACASARG
jgi:RNA polymerase-binding transcription factor